MLLIINKSTKPEFNLALEEYLLTQTELECIMLWRNERSVIIGNNQNAAAELDTEYVKANGITVIRRQSGGGAVFHDLGNINFTVIHKLGDDDFSNYAKFTAPICDFLGTLGIDARLEGRNDLVIDGLKFSGNAQAVKNNRIMHHGTILYNANFGELAAALRPNTAKIESKGIKSVRARVTNVASHLENPMDAEEFFARLANYFRGNVEGIGEYELTDIDVAKTQELVDAKYGVWEWNFGKSPEYTYEKSIRLESGAINLKLNVERGIIKNAYISGDFFGVLDGRELEQKLAGLRHDRESVAAVIDENKLQSYIFGASKEDFLTLF